MWERYHLTLAVQALAVGVVVAGVGEWWSRREGDRRPGPAVVHPLGAITWALAVVSLVGVWVGVPDTEAPLVAGALLAPWAAVASGRRRPPGRVATAVLVALPVVSAAIGSAGRLGAFMTWTAVGAVLVAPAVRGFPVRAAGGRGTWVVSALHVVVALAGSRWIMDLRGVAAVAGGAACLAVVALGVVLAMPR